MPPPTRCSTGWFAHRRALGLPATSVNWGPWAQGGMASSDAARANLGARGLIPLEPTAALNALGEIIAHGIGQAIAHQSQLAAGGEAAGRCPPADSRPRAAERWPGDARRQRVASATARRARGAARRFHHRASSARAPADPRARATAGRNQPFPGARHGFADGGRTSQPVAQPVRQRVHDHRHRGVRLSDDRVPRRIPGRSDAGARSRGRHTCIGVGPAA